MKRLTIAVALGCGIAAADTFPDADSSHDISSVTAWGGTIPAAAAFGAPDVTYTAGEDVQFGKVEVKEGHSVFDLSATPGRVVTITNTGSGAFWLSGSNSSLELKSGKWHFPNKGNFSVGSLVSGGYGTNSTVTLSGGCVVTNAGCVGVGCYGNSDSKLIIKDGSFLHVATENGRVAYLSTTRSGASMEILSGGRLYADGMFWIDAGGSSSTPLDCDISLLVSGAGSMFTNKAGMYQGSTGHYGSRVTFTDHASGGIGASICLGYNNPSGGHVFTVEDGANVTCGGSLSIGDGTKTHIVPNRVNVLGGASLYVNNDVKVGAAADTHLNELFVSNAVLSTYRFKVGLSKSTKNRAVFYGPDTSFTVRQSGTLDLFGTGYENELIFDGTTWEHTIGSIYMSVYAATNNLVRITNGGAIKSPKTFYIGYNRAECGSRVEVLNGGSLEITGSSVALKGIDQQLVVSNGTLVCSQLAIGDSAASTNNSFELIGKDSSYTETGRSGTYRIFSYGHNHRMLISDGAVWGYSADGVYTSIGSGVTNTLVRIQRGGHFNVAKGFFIGYSGDQSNRFEVAEGGFLDCRSMTIGGDTQGLAVSNGTVTVTNDCQLGYAQGGGCINRACWITFSGTNPVLTVGTAMVVNRTAELRFIVPEGGYAATPLTIGGKLNIAANCRILVDAERFRQNIGRKEKVVLATFAGSDEVSAEALEASNALLGEGLTLTIENKQIILTAKRDYGFRLIIR